MGVLDNISIPEFGEFKQQPNNVSCLQIDTSRLVVEILWWLEVASTEFSSSTFSSKLLLDGRYALVVRYRREKDWKYHPACTLSFDEKTDKSICINQIQGSNDNIAFRFFSSFNNISFYLLLIEESFSKKWIYVYFNDDNLLLEWLSIVSRANENHKILVLWINALNKKYWLEKKKISNIVLTL